MGTTVRMLDYWPGTAVRWPNCATQSETFGRPKSHLDLESERPRSRQSAVKRICRCLGEASQPDIAARADPRRLWPHARFSPTELVPAR
jgi:hypothetical protein